MFKFFILFYDRGYNVSTLFGGSVSTIDGVITSKWGLCILISRTVFNVLCHAVVRLVLYFMTLEVRAATPSRLSF